MTNIKKDSKTSIPFGHSNRLGYDDCAYRKRLYESTSPMHYQLYQGKFVNDVNCMKEKYGNFKPYELVDFETELLLINKPTSRCDQFKYHPNCPTSDLCTNTYDKSVPIVIPADICPIIHNNIERTVDTGLSLPIKMNAKSNNIMANTEIMAEN